ncbi:MAG: amidohydrolase [Christensenella sp.]|nr:amidohydrolase [Christensenella sp.]
MKIRIENTTVLTNNEDNEVLKNASVLIEDGKISAVGNIVAQPVDRVIDGAKKIVAPGFFNMHTHVPMSVLRGYADDLDLSSWLDTKILPAEDKFTNEMAYWSSMAAICEMTAAGTVCFNEMYFFMDAVAKAAKDSGIRAGLSRAVVTVTPEAAERTFRESVELFEKYNGQGRLKVYLSPHAQYTVDNEMLEQIGRKAKELGTGIHMHISETQREHLNCVKENMATPIALAERLGLLESPFFAAHCVWVDENDMEIMAQKGASVLSCPRSNLKLASGIAPLSKMLEKGVRVTLGTDGAASNNKLSVMDEMTYAALLQKGTTYNPRTIPAAQAFKLATSSGATALGINSGTIEAGKNADIIMINADGIRYIPDYDPVSSIVYAGEGSDVCMTMVGGDILYENGKFSFADPEEIKARLKEYSQIIKAV